MMPSPIAGPKMKALMERWSRYVFPTLHGLPMPSEEELAALGLPETVTQPRLRTLTCAVCGSYFQRPVKRGPSPKHCSDRCRDEARRRVQAEADERGTHP